MRKYMVGIIGLILLVVVISTSNALIVAYAKANKDWVGSLIGSLGNIIGGVLGGFIAYFVAKYQIDEARARDLQQERAEANNVAVILKEELKNNSMTLESIVDSGELDPSLIKYNLTREAWMFFSSKFVHKLDEVLFISLNTLYRKIQLFQTMPHDEIQSDISIDQIKRLKFQCDDCTRKLDEFIRANK
ncbi:hypothetical protein [Paenibacillus sp. MBLB4367]|uniref:hypothetical protein n=1 Tax=Paenibacillus sp. MBLB4367 TaxID=3384767 RepID=UPI003907EADB